MPRSQSSVVIRWAIILLGIMGAFFVTSYFRLDPDFGWHLRSGQYILAHGLPRYDVFTFTASNFPWVNHEWLVDVGITKLYAVGGYGLVAAIFAGIWLTAVVLASRRWSWVALAIGTLGLLPYVGVRPIAISALLFVITEHSLRWTGRRRWLIPLLFMLWANLHAGFALGLVVVWWTAAQRRDRSLFFVATASTLATLINPYGWNVYTEIFRTIFDVTLRGRVVEWLPLYFQYPTQMYLVAFLACYWFFVTKKFRSALSLPGLLFLAALSSSRHAPFFILGSLRYFENYLSNIPKRLPRPLIGPQRIVAAILAVIVVIIVGSGYAFALRPPYDRERPYPQSAVAYLAAHPCPGNLYNAYTVGGYLLWKLPTQKVYIDGRMPSWKLGTTDYFANYRRVQTDPDFRRLEFSRLAIRCVLILTTQPTPAGFEAKLQRWMFGQTTERDLRQELLRAGWQERIQDNGHSLLIDPSPVIATAASVFSAELLGSPT